MKLILVMVVMVRLTFIEMMMVVMLIDFGGTLENRFGDTEIDFGTEEGGDIDSGDVDVSANRGGGLQVESAKDEEAHRMLGQSENQSSDLDELEELRTLDPANGGESSSGVKYNLVSNEDDMDPDTLMKMIKAVEKITSNLTESKVQQLQLIRGSPAVVDRLVEKLQRNP